MSVVCVCCGVCLCVCGVCGVCVWVVCGVCVSGVYESVVCCVKCV